jgi:hypothetical protein
MTRHRWPIAESLIFDAIDVPVGIENFMRPADA